MPEDKIRFIQTFTGGAFGGKTWQQVWPITAVLARKAGRPVRIVLTRQEEFEATLPRVPMIIDLSMGVYRDGRLAFKETRIMSGNGAYSISAPAVHYVAATRYDSLYRLGNIRCTADLVYTNTVPTGMFRGFGNPQMHFAGESMMDMLAEAVGIDPVEIRRRNAALPGDTSAHGWYLGSCAVQETIEKAAEATDLVNRRRGGRPLADGKTFWGIGMASCIHVAGNRTIYKPYDGSNARVQVSGDGSVVVYSGEADLGQGCRTVFAQIAAEVLGVPMDAVTVAAADTDFSPFAIGTVASRVTTLGGLAVDLAAKDARDKILAAAAENWGVPAQALDMENGSVISRSHPERRLSFPVAAEIASDALGGKPVIGVGEYRTEGVVLPDPQTKYGNIAIAYSFGTQVAEVLVDTETGRVRVLRFVAAHDVGRAINPLGVEGQIEGGIAQGIGYALLEEIKMDRGRVLNPDFLDYRIPTSVDIPPIESILVEPDDPNGPFGAKSVGETAVVPTVAAVANAIYDAIGVRLTDLPMTPDRILAALREKRAGSQPSSSGA
jgi:CO/xanthine dehydrogenase Mo-binding subunit